LYEFYSFEAPARVAVVIFQKRLIFSRRCRNRLSARLLDNHLTSVAEKKIAVAVLIDVSTELEGMKQSVIQSLTSNVKHFNARVGHHSGRRTFDRP